MPETDAAASGSTSAAHRPRSRSPQNKCLLKVRQNGTFAVRIYSDDSKTDEPIKVLQNFPFSDLDVFGEIIHRSGVSSDI